MVTAITPASIASADPNVFNTGTELAISMPVANVGATTADKVTVSAATLASASRLSPRDFPLYLGRLAQGNSANLNLRFSAGGLAAGQKLLLTVRGSYAAPDTTGFVLNRYITVPAAAPYPVSLLRSHVEVARQPAIWSYSVFNDEGAGSALYIASFSLSIVAPASVMASPPGWQFDTDNSSYVGWFATDLALPYPGHIAPGASLSGFQIQSATTGSEATPYMLTSWRHDADSAGPIGIDVVLSPARAR